jgi:hypothetical protein
MRLTWSKLRVSISIGLPSDQWRWRVTARYVTAYHARDRAPRTRDCLGPAGQWRSGRQADGSKLQLKYFHSNTRVTVSGRQAVLKRPPGGGDEPRRLRRLEGGGGGGRGCVVAAANDVLAAHLCRWGRGEGGGGGSQKGRF